MGKASADIERQMAAAALDKRRRGVKPTAQELAALRRVEAAREEELRWEYYESVPKRHYVELSGRQPKILNEQADRYGLPLRGRTVNLREVIRGFHALLAANKHRLAARGEEDDGLMASGRGRWIEAYRREKALLARMERREREGHLIPRPRLRTCLGLISSLLRRTADTLQRQFGAEAHGVLSEGLDEVERAIRDFLGETQCADSDDQSSD